MSKLRKILGELGGSKDKIAEKLHREKIKGLPGAVTFCPIANYLKKRLPGIVAVMVEITNISVYTSYISTIDTPEIIKEFIEEFDKEDGSYKYLISEEDL